MLERILANRRLRCHTDHGQVASTTPEERLPCISGPFLYYRHPLSPSLSPSSRRLFFNLEGPLFKHSPASHDFDFQLRNIFTLFPLTCILILIPLHLPTRIIAVGANETLPPITTFSLTNSAPFVVTAASFPTAAYFLFPPHLVLSPHPTTCWSRPPPFFSPKGPCNITLLSLFPLQICLSRIWVSRSRISLRRLRSTLLRCSRLDTGILDIREIPLGWELIQRISF